MTSPVVHRAAVLGHPVDHSLSPVLHGAAYDALGLTDWAYGRHDVTQERFVPFVDGLDESWRGLSLTMPLKEVAAQVADRVCDTARLAGAINTLVRVGDGWHADNTDVHGLTTALTEAGAVASTGDVATVLGGGATARSALCALRDLGFGEVIVAARTPEKARAALERTAAELGLTVAYVPLGEWATRDSAVVLSTLAPGGSAAAAEALSTRGSHSQTQADGATRAHDAPVMLDVVYAHWPTPLARAAAQAGFIVVSGLEMLIHQAVRQVELMTGHTCGPAVVAAMASAARTATARN